jgi:hypothetical protein
MGETMKDLPEGFVLDSPGGSSDLPDGFVLDQPKQPRGTFGDALAQGLTFGFSDELYGGVTAPVRMAIDRAQGGKMTLGEAYGKGRDFVRGQVAAYRDDNPGKAAAGEFVGGMMTAGGVGAKAAQGAATLGQQALRGAAAGAAYGGAYGFGSGEGGFVERAKDAAASAALGGAIGAAAPVVATGVARGFGAAKNIVTGGPKKNVSQAAAERVAKALSDDGVDLRKLAQSLQKGETVFDRATRENAPNLTGLAGSAYRAPGPGRAMTEQFFENRADDMAGAVSKAAQKGLKGAQGETYYATLESLRNARKAKAEPLYQQAQRVGRIASKRLNEFMRRPVFQEAMERAAREADDMGRTLPNVIKRDPATGRFFSSPEGLDTEAVQFIKEGLDGKIDAAMREAPWGRAHTSESRRLSIIKDAFLKEVDKANPAYAAARQAWAGETANMRAMELGRSLLSGRRDVELFADDIAKMSGSEKEFFRAGVARAIYDKLQTTPDGLDAANRMIRTPAMRSKLRLAFPDQRSFDRFLSSVEGESRVFRSGTKIMRGSQTAGREVDDAVQSMQYSRQIAAGVLDVMQGNPQNIAWRVLNRVGDRAAGMNPQIAEEVSKILYNPNLPQNLEVLRRAIAQQGQVAVRAPFRPALLQGAAAGSLAATVNP